MSNDLRDRKMGRELLYFGLGFCLAVSLFFMAPSSGSVTDGGNLLCPTTVPSFNAATVVINAATVINNGNDGASTNHRDVSDPILQVEDLMYQYGSDKSRDDHGYSKFYEMVFAPIRKSVLNMTEVGVASGNSIQAWYRYFPNAEIHGFDLHVEDTVLDNLAKLQPRVNVHILDILEGTNTLDDLGFQKESMDVIIEDGNHQHTQQQDLLEKLFPLLKPGGLYIIEDVGYNQGGIEAFHDTPDKARPLTRSIFENHDTVWIDASIGHRAWDEWARRSTTMWVANRTHHNSYCVVIQKRKKPLPPIQMNFGSWAMVPDKIVREK